MMGSESSGSIEKAVNRRVGSSSSIPSFVKAYVVEDVKKMQVTADGKSNCGKSMVRKEYQRMFSKTEHDVMALRATRPARPTKF